MQRYSTLFEAACRVQTSLNAWADCQHERCRQLKTCTGGPRGTCAKTGGWPGCTEEGHERLKIAKARKFWPGEEKALEGETRSEYRMRRLNQEVEDARFKMEIAGLLRR